MIDAGKPQMKSSEVEVVLVGNELLKGDRRDAHLAYIGRVSMSVGVRVSAAHVVGDDGRCIARLIGERIRESRVLIVSGGLGPTHDDVTREGVAEGLGLSLRFDEGEWRTIQKIFAGFGRTADDSNRRQAYFPEGATPIANARGTAAGFMIEQTGCLVAVLPGPPRELIPMMESVVVPRMKDIFSRAPLFTTTYRTTGIGESSMTPLVGPIFERFDDFDFSSLPHIGGVDLIATQKTAGADAEALRARAVELEKALRVALGEKLYATGKSSLDEALGAALALRGETLAVAESLTGGLIGKRLTDVPGSSRYLLADVVAYSNDAKIDFLGVKADTLIEHGAVSEPVCGEMADGVRQKTGATYGLSTTGIAGPDGGTADKPVGLTYIGLASTDLAVVEHRVFPGAREDVRERVAFAALWLLHRHLGQR